MQSLSLSLRPETLEDVIGHEKVVAAVKDTLARDVVPSAFLLSGPPGVGKTTLALILARLVQGDILPGTEEHLDIQVVNAADMNGVDAAREMVANAVNCPFVGRYRVRVLDEAQQLTAQAQNCFLNPLERTGNSTVWIFTTTDPNKLIPALKSRCLHFALKPMAEREITALAQRAAEKSGVEFDPAFVRAMQTHGLTSPREILMAFDKWVSGVPLSQVAENPETEPLYADIAKALLSGNWTGLTALLDQVKTPDIRALRAVVSAFLGGALLRRDFGAEADAYSNCLLGLGQNSAFEDGVAKNLTWAVFYRCCVQIRKAKGGGA